MQLAELCDCEHRLVRGSSPKNLQCKGTPVSPKAPQEQQEQMAELCRLQALSSRSHSPPGNHQDACQPGRLGFPCNTFKKGNEAKRSRCRWCFAQENSEGRYISMTTPLGRFRTLKGTAVVPQNQWFLQEHVPHLKSSTSMAWPQPWGRGFANRAPHRGQPVLARKNIWREAYLTAQNSGGPPSNRNG